MSSRSLLGSSLRSSLLAASVRRCTACPHRSSSAALRCHSSCERIHTRDSCRCSQKSLSKGLCRLWLTATAKLLRSRPANAKTLLSTSS